MVPDRAANCIGGRLRVAVGPVSRVRRRACRRSSSSVSLSRRPGFRCCGRRESCRLLPRARFRLRMAAARKSHRTGNRPFRAPGRPRARLWVSPRNSTDYPSVMISGRLPTGPRRGARLVRTAARPRSVSAVLATQADDSLGWGGKGDLLKVVGISARSHRSSDAVPVVGKVAATLRNGVVRLLFHAIRATGSGCTEGLRGQRPLPDRAMRWSAVGSRQGEG